MFISTSQTPVLVCPEKFESEADRNVDIQSKSKQIYISL
jgi:hypothetical protein